MAYGKDEIGCSVMSMIVSGLAGLVAMAMLMLIGDWSFLQAAFGGIIVAIILLFIALKFICTGSTAKEDLAAVQAGTRGPVAAGTAGKASADKAGTAPAAAAATGGAATASTASAGATSAAAAAGATTPSKAFAMQPSTPLAGEAELAGRKGEWKYEGDAKPAVKAKKPAAKKPAAKKPAAKKPAAKKAAAESGATAKSEKPKRAAVAADGKPETLTGPRDGGTADDLKLISGVGPKLETTLNELGFWHFDQIAKWRKKEIEWVDSRLKFKGRIVRDDWMSQAKILAKGGETEFSSRKKK